MIEVLFLFPALSLLPGHRPAHEQMCSAVLNGFISVPISAMIAQEAVVLIPSVRVNCVFIAIPDTRKVDSHKFTHKRYKAWILSFNPHLPEPPFHKPGKGDPSLQLWICADSLEEGGYNKALM